MNRGYGYLLIAMTWVGCRGAGAATPSPAVTPQASAAPARLVEPVDVVGREIDGHVPLLGGGALALEELRGQIVLLELATTTEPYWLQAQRRWRELVSAYGTRLRIVTVAAQPDAGVARSHWDLDPPPFVLGWDPQGALALRLGITRLPTRLVLDRQGRVLATIEGAGMDRVDAVAEAVQRALEEG